jgi:hypothetical protein
MIFSNSPAGDNPERGRGPKEAPVRLENLALSHSVGNAWNFSHQEACGEIMGKIMLEISSRGVRIDGRQSSGVRSSSFTAMNALVSSEAANLRWFMSEFLNRQADSFV